MCSTDLRKIRRYQVPWKSCQREPSCSMWTDRMTDMTKLIVAFRNFAKAPKQHILASSRSSQYIRIPTNSVRRTKKNTIKFSRISEWYTKLIRQKLRYSFPNFQGIIIVWLMFVTDVPSHNYAWMSLCQYYRKLKGKSLCSKFVHWKILYIYIYI
jgi:Zn-finger nucleic acid-binding protein